MPNLQGVFARNDKFKTFEQMSAAADFLGNGAIEVADYEPEIIDIVERSSAFLSRIRKLPATGHPHRWFEETAIGTASFTDPRNITPSASGPTRLENAAFIKAITAQTNLSLFDVNVTQQQGKFAYLESKDITDSVNAITRLKAQNVWNGNDTALNAPTTIQYVGLLTQIQTATTIAQGASIVDGLKAEVAQLVASTAYDINVSAIYINPVLGDYIDRECKSMAIEMGEQEITAGVKVKTLMTQAGPLPLIPEKWLPKSGVAAFGFSAPPTGLNNYFAVIITESLIEMPYISGSDDNPNPRIFQLGLVGGLQGQYVAIQFDAVIAKAAGYAHAIVCVVRQ
jgi:hypothetical protein